MNAEKTVEILAAQGVPVPKAATMVRSVWKGLGLCFLGGLLILSAIATLYFIVVNLKQLPTGGIMVLVLALALSGIYFLVSGGNVMSGQALDATADSPIFGRIAKTIRFFRDKT